MAYIPEDAMSQDVQMFVLMCTLTAADIAPKGPNAQEHA